MVSKNVHTLSNKLSLRNVTSDTAMFRLLAQQQCPKKMQTRKGDQIFLHSISKLACIFCTSSDNSHPLFWLHCITLPIGTTARYGIVAE